MSRVFSDPDIMKGSANELDPAMFVSMIGWFYALFAVVVIVMGIVNFMTARCLSRRKSRTFCLVVAGLNCLQVPLGTVLGVFTIVVLMRDSVRTKFGA